jgi:hypothetical protein
VAPPVMSTFWKRTSDLKEKMLGFLIQIFIFDFSTIPAKGANKWPTLRLIDLNKKRLPLRGTAWIEPF